MTNHLARQEILKNYLPLDLSPHFTHPILYNPLTDILKFESSIQLRFLLPHTTIDTIKTLVFITSEYDKRQLESQLQTKVGREALVRTYISVSSTQMLERVVIVVDWDLPKDSPLGVWRRTILEYLEVLSQRGGKLPEPNFEKVRIDVVYIGKGGA